MISAVLLLVPLLVPLVTPVIASGGEERRYEHPIELDAQRAELPDTGGSCLIRGATIHSAVGPAETGDVLVREGKIARIGRGLDAPEGVMEFDGSGKHLAPGAIDTHSHIAIEGNVNEGTRSITSDCDITDVIDPDDVGIWRALAGGTTTIQCLHGSANTVGGRSEVIKLRWKRRADELRFPDAPQGIKFALGENVKRSNGGSNDRFPNTRMGVEAVLVRGFERAWEYQQEWAAYRQGLARGEDPAPPRRDVRLEVLAGVLDGSVHVHSHCYRADEILMLLRVAERFGVRLQTLQHVLEGYKVAHEMARHGVGGSTFSDWWAYKIEAYDAIPQNAALMDEAGVVATVNSDSAELMRHLFQEAGKSVRYAGMDRVRALRLATLNGAAQLGIQERVGSIEVGKDADLVLFDGDPLSFTARVEWTLVDGRIEFARRDAFGLAERPCAATPLPEEGLAGEVPAQGFTLAIVGATLHPVTGPDVVGGTLIVRGGRIAALGRDLAIPADAAVIDAQGGHVWPGLIALDTSIGLREIDSVRGTLDLSEIGGNQPDLRAAAAIHPDSAHIAVSRYDGITLSQSAPEGGGPIRGQSAVIRLAGETWEEMLVQPTSMLHLAFPTTPNTAEDKKEPEAVVELRRLFEEAREHGRVADLAQEGRAEPPLLDPRLDALVPYARGERTVALHADNAQTILYALKFAKEQKLRAVLFGAREAWKVVEVLAREQVPVVVGPVLALPTDRSDPYDACYANPAVLCRAGVPFAIMANDSENPRHLVHDAAMAVAFGLPREEALRAITWYPARLLGLEAERGSLAVGKVADVIVTDGDLFDTTARVTHVLIDGRPASMENRQTRLWERYRDRLRRLQGK